MLEPSPITNRSLGNGRTRANARNAVNTIVTAAARRLDDFKMAATSRDAPSRQEITDCTETLLCQRLNSPFVLASRAKIPGRGRSQLFACCRAFQEYLN